MARYCRDRYEGQLRANIYGATKYVVADVETGRIVAELDENDQLLTHESARSLAAGMNAIIWQQRRRHGRCAGHPRTRDRGQSSV